MSEETREELRGETEQGTGGEHHHHHHHHHSGSGRHHHKKKMAVWKKVLIILLVVVAAVFVGALVYVNTKLSKLSRVTEEVRIPREQETFEVETDEDGNVSPDTITPEEISFEGVDIDVMRDANVKNILLIGQDKRPGEGRSRSDSMIIASINKTSGKIILSSIMRDMYVPIPGYSDNRINMAYQFGGMSLLDEVIEESLGIHIDGNIEVDFEGFINAMSVVGDLDIDLNEREVEYFNRKHPDWNFHVGVNSLNPEQTLAYARCRSVGNSDWRRTDRQRTVLMAAFNKLSSQGLGELLSLTDEIFPYLKTDMSNSQILGYVYTIVANHIILGESHRFPVEGTYREETLRKGMEVLVPDLEANARNLQIFIYGSTNN